MPDREGPKASVVLSCGGCRHYADMGAGVRSWCRARGEHATFARQPETPDWCPYRPGPLVAVPLQVIRQMERGYAGVPEMLIDAQALGQEIPNE